MKIENPFESGQIKNYILAYVGVVVIMILFFIAAKLWSTPKEMKKREFKSKELSLEPKKKKNEPKSQTTKLYLLPKSTNSTHK